MHPHGPRGKEDLRRGAGRADHRPGRFGREAVVDDGIAAPVHRHAVFGDRLVAGEYQDHLQPRVRFHECAVRRAESRQVLRRSAK